jgi:hypothetical protein
VSAHKCTMWRNIKKPRNLLTRCAAYDLVHV